MLNPLRTALAVFAVGSCLVLSTACGSKRPVRFDFDQDPGVAATAAGWRAESSTSSPTGTWTIHHGTLALAGLEGTDRKRFNLLWREDQQFLDGTLSVRLRADGGIVDQGGGLMWRVKDARNYYLARYNPLETNLRVYHVKDGNRTMLQDATDLLVKTGEWTTLLVEQTGDHIVVSLDGTPFLDVHDPTIPDPGGIGLWTKADAASTFDELEVACR